MVDTGDEACLAALATALGHAPPFGPKELAGIESLTITQARDLTLIRGCTRLTHLKIVASELEHLDELSALTALSHLEIHCTKLGAWRGIGSSESLVRIDLLFTSVTQSVDLFGVGKHVGRGPGRRARLRPPSDRFSGGVDGLTRSPTSPPSSHFALLWRVALAAVVKSRAARFDDRSALETVLAAIRKDSAAHPKLLPIVMRSSANRMRRALDALQPGDTK